MTAYAMLHGYVLTEITGIEINGRPFSVGDILNMEAVLAATRTAEAQAVAEGWKLVPVDPTQAMLDAGYYPSVQGRGAKSTWQEMLAASPATGGT